MCDGYLAVDKLLPEELCAEIDALADAPLSSVSPPGGILKWTDISYAREGDLGPELRGRVRSAVESSRVVRAAVERAWPRSCAHTVCAA